MEISELIKMLLSVIPALNSNNTSQNFGNSNTMQQKPNDIDNPYWSLPNYDSFEQHIATQTTGQQERTQGFENDIQQNISQQSSGNTQPTTQNNLLQLLSSLDINKILPIISQLFKSKNQVVETQTKKDVETSFNNNLTKADDYNY